MKNKKKKKLTLEMLTDKDIELMTKHAEKRTDIPLVQPKQVNMRLNAEILSKAKKLAEVQGKPVTTFLASLIKEDIARMWGVYKINR